jgi:hypothetical protein
MGDGKGASYIAWWPTCRHCGDMRNARKRPDVSPLLASLLAYALFGCEAHPAVTRGSVCPSCGPQLGGETGDFGGGFGACSLMFVKTDIDASTAEKLGFPISEIERRAARGIDASLLWRVIDADPPARGYADKTRVQASIAIMSYRHFALDPAACDGSVCRRDGHEIPQSDCYEYLRMDAEVELRTLDGAVSARLTGHARQELANDRARTPFESVEISVNADLREVIGTLVVSPNGASGPYRGELALAASLHAGQAQGVLTPFIFFKEPTAESYLPLEGGFPIEWYTSD